MSANPRAIQPRVERDYVGPDKYGGVGIRGRTGKTEKGIPWILFLQWIKDKATRTGLGDVLEDDKPDYVSAATRKAFIKNLAKDGRLLERTVADTNAAAKKRAVLTRAISDGVKVMTEMDKKRNRYCEMAQRVLAMIKDAVTAAVLNMITAIEIKHARNTEAALDEFLRLAANRFAGDPADRRTQLNEMLTAVGTAHNKEQLQLLVSNVQYLADIADIALFVPNPANTVGARRRADIQARQDGEEPVYPPEYILADEAVPNFTARELLDAVLRRIIVSNAAAADLMPYRELAIQEKAQLDYASFAQFVYNFETRLGMDQSSLEEEEATAHAHAAMYGSKPKAFAAAAHQGGGEDFTDMLGRAFAAGVHSEEHARHDDKHQDESPYKRQRRPVCYYWDGGRCNYEERTGRQCDFSAGHIAGQNTKTRNWQPLSEKMFQQQQHQGAAAAAPRAPAAGPTLEDLRQLNPAAYQQLMAASSSTGGAPSSTGHGHAPPQHGGGHGPYPQG